MYDSAGMSYDNHYDAMPQGLIRAFPEHLRGTWGRTVNGERMTWHDHVGASKALTYALRHNLEKLGPDCLADRVGAVPIDSLMRRLRDRRVLRGGFRWSPSQLIHTAMWSDGSRFNLWFEPNRLDPVKISAMQGHDQRYKIDTQSNPQLAQKLTSENLVQRVGSSKGLFHGTASCLAIEISVDGFIRPGGKATWKKRDVLCSSSVVSSGQSSHKIAGIREYSEVYLDFDTQRLGEYLDMHPEREDYVNELGVHGFKTALPFSLVDAVKHSKSGCLLYKISSEILVNNYIGGTWQSTPGDYCSNQRCEVWLITGWRICPLCWCPVDQMGREELVRITPAAERPRVLVEVGIRNDDAPLTTSQRRNKKLKAQNKQKSAAQNLNERNKKKSKKCINEGHEGHTHKWDNDPAYVIECKNCDPPFPRILEGGYP